MITDARTLGGVFILRCDVCIVGAGPAGISIARELGLRGFDVILLDSGGKKFDKSAHDLDKGTTSDNASHGPLEDYRRRRLGGSTTAWGGRCVPFDAIDFEERDFVPHSGWPITKRDLDPYYERAHEYAELGPYTYSARESLERGAADKPMIPGLDDPELTMDAIYRFSPPTNFGARFERDLTDSPNVRVLLHATAQELVLDRDGNSVERLTIVSTSGHKLTLIGRRFVLAGGGLEVTRLMLASQSKSDAGVGNQHDLLGRYYQCHVTHRVDVMLERAGLVWDYERTKEGVYCQRTLSVTEAGQRKHRILNHRARVEHPEISDPAHLSGVLSATYLAKYVVMRQAANPLLSDKVNVISKGVTTTEVVQPGAHLRNVARDVGGVLRFSRRWLRERILAPRKLPSLVLESPSHSYTLRIDAEQAPNPESRLTLGRERDAFGVPRLHVDWRQTELDVSSLERTANMFGEALRAAGIGRARWSAPGKLVATGGHHIGTTRMSRDPKQGVVDENCRVHGVPNLFVASSSVFPTSSYANPTLTIVALALRLADHLAKSPDK